MTRTSDAATAPTRSLAGSGFATLVVVRHGQTSANLDGVWHGSTDTPLTERGHRQAERVARHIAESYDGVRAIYSSDLQRAHDTARPIARALGLEIGLEPGLREFDLGRWEGKTYRELQQRHRLWDRMREDPHYAPHGGESPLGVAERFSDALRRISASHPGELAVVVAHGGALSLAFAALLQGDYTAWGRVMDNCGVSELALAPSPRCERFNQTLHLEGL